MNIKFKETNTGVKYCFDYCLHIGKQIFTKIFYLFRQYIQACSHQVQGIGALI